MTQTFPAAVANQLTALEQLADRYPLYIPVSAAADYLQHQGGWPSRRDRAGDLPLRHQLETG